MTELIRQIELYQKLKGLSDVALARMLDINNAYLGRIKRGLRQPGRKALQALAKIPELNMAVYKYLSTNDKVEAVKGE